MGQLCAAAVSCDAIIAVHDDRMYRTWFACTRNLQYPTRTLSMSCNTLMNGKSLSKDAYC